MTTCNYLYINAGPSDLQYDILCKREDLKALILNEVRCLEDYSIWCLYHVCGCVGACVHVCYGCVIVDCAVYQ